MKNIPTLKLGIVAVSRDCFPMTLSESRRKAVVKAYRDLGEEIYECPTVVENEIDMEKALDEVRREKCNALVVYLGNFGPETPETLLVKKFDGPSMMVAAAEEHADNLIAGRGDAFCGMLNASYNLKLRNLKAYIPAYPVGTPEQVAEMIRDFKPVARAVIGVHNLKVISFGPRPQDFLACNAPIKRLYDLGIEIEENSELDLYLAYEAHKDDKRIAEIADDMKKALGAGNLEPDLLPHLAQYELTIRDWVAEHKGASEFVTVAGKCWPAFEGAFRFVPCYVNGRLTSDGIPVSCEVDIWGTVSEYIGTCVSEDTVTLLDINNTVPQDMYDAEIKGKYDYTNKDVFMGFHCGNTAQDKLCSCEMKYQFIMARTQPKEWTEGTLEGTIIPGNITFFRLQSTADTKLRAYVAQGEVLPVNPNSFGGIGVFAIHDMGRFYRNVLIEKNYPHHGAVAFGHYGQPLFDIFRYLGICDTEINYNQPASVPYPGENPFVIWD